MANALVECQVMIHSSGGGSPTAQARLDVRVVLYGTDVAYDPNINGLDYTHDLSAGQSPCDIRSLIATDVATAATANSVPVDRVVVLGLPEYGG